MKCREFSLSHSLFLNVLQINISIDKMIIVHFIVIIIIVLETIYLIFAIAAISILSNMFFNLFL